MLVANPKNMKTACADVPHRVEMTSRYVWAPGAFILILAVFWANSSTCTVAPAAYQYGPLKP